ncbi:MAG: hypothetical protein ACYTHK_10340 [Planctomycetota bacterium]|jgi:hypothetical protein
MLTAIGCEEVKIDYKTGTATLKVPATVKDEDIEKAVTGKFSATVQQ